MSRRKPPLGSLAWGARDGGRLTRTEALSMFVEAVGVWWAALARPTRTGPAPVWQPSDAPRPPDTAASREAERLCEAACPAGLTNHCRRTFAWASLVARRRGIRYDEELLYVACLLHDLGLTDAYPTPAGRCFALTGATAAAAALRGTGWPEPRVVAAADAVALHLNVRVSVDQGAEAHLLHAGAALDVLGLGLRGLPGPAVDAVLARHPRLGFERWLAERMRAEAERSPRCRAAFFVRMVGLARIARAPFPE